MLKVGTYQKLFLYLSEVVSWTSQRFTVFDLSEVGVVGFAWVFDVLDLSEVIFADLSEVGFSTSQRSAFVPGCVLNLAPNLRRRRQSALGSFVPPGGGAGLRKSYFVSGRSALPAYDFA